ncbi:MAG: flagellar motor switch protein FliG, partial [Alphaproteobacteria bacterium]|nr:flagellar motor switch protein FliG [Alphaproteobacteria bacterium]
MDSRVRTDLRTIDGTEKAAIIMLSVAEDVAQDLFALMDEDEIREISQTIAKLGTIDAAVIESLFVEFADQLSSTGSLTGTMASTERLLAKALPGEEVNTIMEEIRGPAGRTMWDKLANVHETVLASYLKNEYPQTVAVIVSKIRPDHAARVLSALPESFSMEVVMRMLHMESVQKDILDDVEQTLRTDFMSNLAR